jgi:histidyl-tRNA synthetase
MKIRGVKGTRDVLPIDTYLKDEDPWVRVGHLQLIERTARELFPLYGYREARTPILERTDLFVRGIGQETDIVGKEMYTFDDKGESLTLRPESTASVVRAYLEHNVNQQEPETRWWYLGPMFRRERQQRGRYRQFTQIGVEALGNPGPRIDAEQIELLDRWLRKLGIAFEMHLNTLGDENCRPKYREALQKYLRSRIDELCADCKKRVETNPIRVLDCKNPGCAEVAAQAPKMEQFLCDACRAHFAGVQEALQRLGVSTAIDPRLVRV